MNIFFKISQTGLAIIFTFFMIGCTSEKVKIDTIKHTDSENFQINPPNQKPIQSKNEVISTSPSLTVLRFKIKPPIVDVHDQSGKIGTSDDKGVFQIQVPSGNDRTFYFKKTGYAKKSLELNASGEMHISYLRLDPLIPAVKLAEAGDPQAQLLVGDMYFEGSNGVNLSLSTANYFYTQSAKSDNLESKARLCAVLYQDSNVGEVDNNLKYCQQAAQQNNPTALFYLGLIYKQGNVVDKDSDMSRKYLEHAAKLGLEEAQEELNLFE